MNNKLHKYYILKPNNFYNIRIHSRLIDYAIVPVYDYMLGKYMLALKYNVPVDNITFVGTIEPTGEMLKRFTYQEAIQQFLHDMQKETRDELRSYL